MFMCPTRNILHPTCGTVELQRPCDVGTAGGHFASVFTTNLRICGCLLLPGEQTAETLDFPMLTRTHHWECCVSCLCLMSVCFISDRYYHAAPAASKHTHAA